MSPCCPHCRKPIVLQGVDPEAAIALCVSCRKVFRVDDQLRRFLRGELTPEEQSPVYPNDYDRRLTSVAPEAEEAYLNDLNPYSVDPYLAEPMAVRGGKYRAVIERDDEALILRTSAPGYFEWKSYWTACRAFLFYLVLIPFVPLFLYFISDNLERAVGISTLLGLVYLLLLLGTLWSVVAWSKEGEWELRIHPEGVTFKKNCRSSHETIHLGQCLIQRAEGRGSPTEAFASCFLQLTEEKRVRTIHLFPCASIEERDWLGGEIEKYFISLPSRLKKKV